MGQRRFLERHLLGRRLRLEQAGLRLAQLRLRRVDGLERGPILRLGRLRRRPRLIELLRRVELMPIEILHPRQVEPRALRLGLGGIGLRLGLLDGLLCRIHAGLGQRQVGRRRGSRERRDRPAADRLVRLGCRQIGAGLGERRLEVAGVDLDHELPGRHLLVVGDVQRHHAPADDLRRHGDRIAVDERIVGRDQVEGEPPISRPPPARTSRPPATASQIRRWR